ncbi:uncharacterized protein [Amphiura filiformis]|uniref:uncharacterized protein n=1 Tax=Amphiura filiformis TaxID=82378 RepID=UPI003B227E32
MKIVFTLTCFLSLMPYCLGAWLRPQVCTVPRLPDGAISVPNEQFIQQHGDLLRADPRPVATVEEAPLRESYFKKRQQPLANNVCDETCDWQSLTTAFTLRGQAVQIYQPGGTFGQWFYECKCSGSNNPCKDGSDNPWSRTRCANHYAVHTAIYRECVSNNCGGQMCYYRVGWVKTKSGCCCRRT